MDRKGQARGIVEKFGGLRKGRCRGDFRDVCSFHLCASTTVDKTQTGDRAAFAVSAEDSLAEIAVADSPAGELIDAFSGGWQLKRGLVFFEPASVAGLTDPRKDVMICPKT